MPPQMLESPPPLPDSIKSSMGGGSPFAGVGEMLANKKPSAPAGGSGALKAQGDAVMKVLEQMVGASQAGKTFFSRAMKMVEQGIAAEAQGGPGAPVNPEKGAMGDEGRPGAEGGGMKPPPAFPG